jgi:hypothetical protein
MAYMGRGTPPRFPGFGFFHAPLDHTFAIKVHSDCNYVQGNEGNLDPQHLSYPHRFITSKDLVQPENNNLFVNDPAPQLDYRETAFGLRIFAARAHRPDRRFVRTTNFIMLNAATFHGKPAVNPAKFRHDENLTHQLHWHVPIDDYEHWKYTVNYRFDGPIDWDFLCNDFGELPEDFRLPHDRTNRFKQDREEMRKFSFSGLGPAFYMHDKFATEAQGRIMDRTDEHLGTTDRAIIMARRQLLDAIDDVRAGRDPLFVERDGQPSALEEMFVIAAEIPSDGDLAGDWWRDSLQLSATTTSST